MNSITPTTIRLIEIFDLRPLDWETGKREPIDDEKKNLCARCGKLHAKVFVVEANKKRYEVGSTCCDRLFGWQPSHEDVMNAESVAKDKAVQAALKRVAHPIITLLDEAIVPTPLYVRFSLNILSGRYDYGFGADGTGIWLETQDKTPRRPADIVLPQEDLEQFSQRWKRRKIRAWIADNCKHMARAKQRKLEFGLLDLLGIQV